MRPVVGGRRTVQELEQSRGEAIAGSAREGARKTLGRRLEDSRFARSVWSKKDDAESALRAPESTQPASEVAHAIGDDPAGTPKRRPRAQFCPEPIKSEPHHFPFPRAGGGEN